MSHEANATTPGRVDGIDQSDLLRLAGYNCKRAYLQIVEAFREGVAGFDLRPLDFSILMIVRANPDITPTLLARALRVAPPNMATALDALERRGLVERRTHPQDRRSRVVALTPAGLRLVNEAEAAAAQAESRVLSPLSAAERAELLRLLQRVFQD